VASWLPGSQGEGVADTLFGSGGERLQVAGQAGLIGPRDLEVVEGQGRAGGQQHARVVDELEVQVGLGRVARVPAGRQLLAGGDPAAPGPTHGAGGPGQGGVDPVAQVEHDVVAEDPSRPEQLADHPLGRLARERLIAATPALQVRRMAKTLRWEQAIAARLVARGSGEQEALLVPKVALACFQTAYERWVRRPVRPDRLAGRW